MSGAGEAIAFLTAQAFDVSVKMASSSYPPFLTLWDERRRSLSPGRLFASG
jgi:hypothetical protein